MEIDRTSRTAGANYSGDTTEKTLGDTAEKMLSNTADKTSERHSQGYEQPSVRWNY